MPGVRRRVAGLAHYILGGLSLLTLPGLMEAWSRAERNATALHADVFSRNYHAAATMALVLAGLWLALALALDLRTLARLAPLDLGTGAGAALLLHVMVQPPTPERSWQGFMLGLLMLALWAAAGIAFLATGKRMQADPQARRRWSALHLFGALCLSQPAWLLWALLETR